VLSEEWVKKKKMRVGETYLFSLLPGLGAKPERHEFILYAVLMILNKNNSCSL